MYSYPFQSPPDNAANAYNANDADNADNAFA